MNEAVGIWSHALAATVFVALALWQLRSPDRAPVQLALAGAFAGTAIWALMAAIADPGAAEALAAESLRNLAWLGWGFALVRDGARDSRRTAITLLYGVVALVMLAELAVTLAAGVAPTAAAGTELLLAALWLRLPVTIGALVLVQNLYSAADPEGRAGPGLPLIALGALWSYDLHLYAIAALDRGWAAMLLDLRGIVVLLAAPVFALALRRSDRRPLRLSRTVAFQFLSLIGITLYVALMAMATVGLDRIGGDYARLIQTGFVFATTLAALAILPSDRVRAWCKVQLAKHFFQHRYDYRTEWLRFTETIGAPAVDAVPLGERAIHAVADLTDSPAGLLFTPDESGHLIVQAAWRWGPTGGEPLAPELAETITRSGRILALDTDPAELPAWLVGDGRAWALVPLIHFDRLAGAILLARPPVARALDWEDFDLLRIVGRQLASYLSEARSQEALSTAQRFDEFNRRFAFILHDIKNLVSQLALLARNAERHADNPAFRADMIETLNESAGRMSDLLDRLSRHDRTRAEDPRPIAALALVSDIARRCRADPPIAVSGDPMLLLMADPVRLEQALRHLLQNALDASPAGEPVTISVHRRGLDGVIDIVDHGPGMSSEFMRTRLFRPFASTKAGGFGIGAYEARSLIATMGGRIEVESHVGQGSRFTLVLPRAGMEQAA